MDGHILGVEEETHLGLPRGDERAVEADLDRERTVPPRWAMPWVSEVMTSCPATAAASARTRVRVSTPCPPRPLMTIRCFTSASPSATMACVGQTSTHTPQSVQAA